MNSSYAWVEGIFPTTFGKVKFLLRAKSVMLYGNQSSPIKDTDGKKYYFKGDLIKLLPNKKYFAVEDYMHWSFQEVAKGKTKKSLSSLAIRNRIADSLEEQWNKFVTPALIARAVANELEHERIETWKAIDICESEIEDHKMKLKLIDKRLAVILPMILA